MMEKNYSIEFNNGYTVINLNQILDFFNCKSLLDELPAITGRPNHVLVNCEKISILPRDWIRALMLVQLNLRKINKDMKLVHVNPGVMKSLKQEGIEEYFKMSKDVNEALKEFGIVVKRRMDMEFLNPFLSATIHVLKVQAGTVVTPGQVFIKKPTDTLMGDVSGLIGIVSATFKGSVIISFPKDTFLNVISRMLGEKIYTLEKEVTDGAGEITNMIFGQAKIELNQKGYGIQTALPSVITGEGHSHSARTKGPVMVVPFDSDVGSFFVEIGLSD